MATPVVVTAAAAAVMLVAVTPVVADTNDNGSWKVTHEGRRCKGLPFCMRLPLGNPVKRADFTLRRFH